MPFFALLPRLASFLLFLLLISRTTTLSTPGYTLQPTAYSGENVLLNSYICLDKQQQLCLGISGGAPYYDPLNPIQLQVKWRAAQEDRGVDFLHTRWSVDRVNGYIPFSNFSNYCISRDPQDTRKNVNNAIIRTCGLDNLEVFNLTTFRTNVKENGTIFLRSDPTMCLTMMNCNARSSKFCDSASTTPYTGSQWSNLQALRGSAVKFSPCRGLDSQQFRQQLDCAPGCTVFMLGGTCDPECNNAVCKSDNYACKTSAPTPPTRRPTSFPSNSPTTSRPTISPTKGPTKVPTSRTPTLIPSNSPTTTPTTRIPSRLPTHRPTLPLDIILPTEPICFGESYTIVFSGPRLSDFGTKSRCAFYNSANDMLVSIPIVFDNSTFAHCSIKSITSMTLARFDLWLGATASTKFYEDQIPLNSISACAYWVKVPQLSSRTCWSASVFTTTLQQPETADFHITGRSIRAVGAARWMCAMVVNGVRSQVRAERLNATSDDVAVCRLNPYGNLFDALPFIAQAETQIRYVDSSEFFIPDVAKSNLKIEGCLDVVIPPARKEEVARLPTCAVDCCLLRERTIVLQGPSADGVKTCDWYDSQNKWLATTPVTLSKFDVKSSFLNYTCKFKIWNPPNLTDVVDVKTVKVFAKDRNATSTLLGERTLVSSTQLGNCIVSEINTKTVVLGGPLVVRFNGPTFRDLLSSVAFYCYLVYPDTPRGQGKLMGSTESGKSADNGLECTIDSVYDSLTGASIAVRMVSKSAAERRALQSGVDLGTDLFVEPLTGVTVTSQVTSSVQSECANNNTRTSASVVAFSGDGVQVLKSKLKCVARNGTTASGQYATYDIATNSLLCGFFTNQIAMTYSATITRADTNASVVISDGVITNPCFLAAAAPTVSPIPAGGLSDGAIAGIVIGVLAALILLLLLIFFALRRKDDKENRKENPAGKSDVEAPMAKAAAVASVPAVVVVTKHATNETEVNSALVLDGASVGVVGAAATAAAVSNAPRKFQKGDIVQCRDFQDDPNWRMSVILEERGQHDYILEDEKLVFAESNLRWPKYGQGDDVESNTVGKPHVWTPAVVAYCDPENGLIRLVGAKVEVPIRNVRPAPFKIGDAVEERGSDKEWRPAVVVGREKDGSYVVDGPGGVGMMRASRNLRWPKYAGGDIVEVKNSDNGRWTRATVVAAEGIVIVCIEDGTVDPKRYPVARVRRPEKAPLLNETAMLGSFMDTTTIRKFKKRDPLDFHEFPDFCFEITVNKKDGLGVRFGWTRDHLVVVQKFLNVPGMDAGPLEASEMVSYGDQLISVNGLLIGGRSFAEVTDMIRTSPDRISLKFGRWKDTIGSLSRMDRSSIMVSQKEDLSMM